MMALFGSGDWVSQDSVTESQHEQYQEPDSEAATCNSAMDEHVICFGLLFDHGIYWHF